MLDTGDVILVVADHAGEQKGGVFDVTGNRTAVVERIDEWEDAAQRDQTVGGFEANDAAPGGRDADGPAGVGAERAGGEFSDHGRGGASGGATGNAVERPRVVDRAEVAGGGGAAHSELMQVGLAEHDRPRTAKLRDDKGVFGWYPVVEDQAGDSGADAGCVDVVLDGQGNTMQGPTEVSGGGFVIENGGFAESALASNGDEGVKSGIELVDPCDKGLRKRCCGEVTAADAGGGFR